mgnify:FL=1
MRISSLLAVASVAVLVAPALAADGQQRARVVSVTGEVAYAPSAGAAYQPLEAGDRLAVGARVRSGEGAGAVLALVTGTAVKIAANTEVSISELRERERGAAGSKAKALLSLSNGTVSALIEPQRTRETDFEFQTPHGVAAARGTFYSVTVADGKTYVGVKKGRVGLVALEDAAR